MALGVASLVTPTGNVAPTLNAGTFQGAFVNKAEFTHGAGETCAAGEYRQYVKGEFRANGSIVAHSLCGNVMLNKTLFQEDGCGPGPTSNPCTAYGHRACNTNPKDNYTPTQSTGCRFYMEDEPGFKNVTSGVNYKVDLSFKCELINTTTGAVLRSAAWTVNGQTTVPFVIAEAGMAGLQATDRILAVRTARNSETGAAEVHVIVARRASEPALDPAAISVVLRDALDREVLPVSQPMVYEVSGRARATASFVYTIPENTPAPAKAEIDVSGEKFTMAVVADG